MKKLFFILMLFTVFYSVAQDNNKKWSGIINAEFSFGIIGDAKDYDYISAGIAVSYGLLFNKHYFAGIGTKPNYIFSDGDFDGFFLPIYGEFKYQSSINKKQLGGFGIARLGYSPIDQRGIYAHIGGGLIYKKWEFGLGISYQNTTFKEEFFDEYWYNDYNLVFKTITVGYKF